MTDTFRAMCAELATTLAERIDDKGDAGPYYAHAARLLDRARALLAEPPSLKKQALKALHTSVDLDEFPEQYNTIRRALEALPE